MSNDMYDADGDIARYLQIPLPEPHQMINVPDVEPEAAHFVGPQHVPAEHHALQAPPPMMPNTVPATSSHAPAMDVFQRYRAAVAMEVEQYQHHQPPTLDNQPPPPLMLPPNPEQASGFPLPETPFAAATGVDGVLPSFDEGTFHGAPAGSQSFHDQFTNDEVAAVVRGIDQVQLGNAAGDAVVEVEPTVNRELLHERDGGPSNTAENPSLAERRRRIANMSMADAANLLHMNIEDAAKHLNISSSSLKRLCNKSGDNHRWPARKINALNKQIKKLEEASVRNVGRKGMLDIKEKLDKLKIDRAKLYESTMKRIRRIETKKDAGPSGSK